MKKRLTQREKAERAAIKKNLQDEGVIPPDKPRLNRKKFAQETWAEWRTLRDDDPIRSKIMLIHAVGAMVGPNMNKVTLEDVGVLKLLKLAVEYDRFLKKLESEGRKEYKLSEYYNEVYDPVKKL